MHLALLLVANVLTGETAQATAPSPEKRTPVRAGDPVSASSGSATLLPRDNPLAVDLRLDVDDPLAPPRVKPFDGYGRSSDLVWTLQSRSGASATGTTASRIPAWIPWTVFGALGVGASALLASSFATATTSRTVGTASPNSAATTVFVLWLLGGVH